MISSQAGWLQWEIYKKLHVKYKAELDDSVEVETLHENSIIKWSQVRVEGFHNPDGQTKIRADGAYDIQLAWMPRILLMSPVLYNRIPILFLNFYLSYPRIVLIVTLSLTATVLNKFIYYKYIQELRAFIYSAYIGLD